MKWVDIKHAQVADIYQQDILVGQITRTPRGSVFAYNQAFIEQSGQPEGIAYNIPKSNKPYEVHGVNLHTYFAGLLPEGLRLRVLTRKTKTSEDDLLSLLIASGPDCIGDISVVPEKSPLPEGVPTVDLKRIGQSSFTDLLQQSLTFSGDEGPSTESNIPGLQEKISAAMISFPLKGKKKPGSYILKLNPPDTPLLVENEDFFLRMAGACGLTVPKAQIVRDRENKTGLLIERFDRVACMSSKTTIRVHQEDACQFLDRYPADKYNIKCSEIAEGLDHWCWVPIIEIANFIRIKAYCYLIANGDMHAKNISIRTHPYTSRIELTPAYDLVSTLPYGDQRMALQFEGRDDNLKRRHFLDFGRRYGVRAAAVHSILDELHEKSRIWIGKLDSIGFPEKKARHLQSVMSKRRDDLGN